jgi:hypothetical protein
MSDTTTNYKGVSLPAGTQQFSTSSTIRGHTQQCYTYIPRKQQLVLLGWTSIHHCCTTSEPELLAPNTGPGALQDLVGVHVCKGTCTCHASKGPED